MLAETRSELNRRAFGNQSNPRKAGIEKMTVKTTGAEFKRFYNDPAFWPKGAWHEDDEILADGEEPDILDEIPGNAVVSITGGIVFGIEGKEPSLESWFKKWKKTQTTVLFVVECDITAKVDLISVIRAAGGKVVK